MMKPEPSEVTWRGVLDFGPRKFLNRSSSGEPGGSCGMAFCGGAFKVWLVEILTTVGKSRLASSAKETGAGRAQAGDKAGVAAISAKMANRIRKAGMFVPRGEESGRQFRRGAREQTGKNPPQPWFFCEPVPRVRPIFPY